MYNEPKSIGFLWAQGGYSGCSIQLKDNREERLDKRSFWRYNGREGVKIMPKIDAQLGIRVTKGLKARLTAQARSEMKSVSALVVQVMEAYLESVGNGKKE